MMAAPKIMPLVLLHWPTTSEVDIGGTAVEVEPSHQYSVIANYSNIAVRQMAAEGHCDTTASDMEKHLKQRCGTEFLHA